MEMDACCKHDIHAQIEYQRPEGAVESLIGVPMPWTDDTRKMLHDMLDEWINKRREIPGPDHFIVFRRWPST